MQDLHLASGRDKQGQLSYKTVPKNRADSGSPEDEALPPAFEELIQIVRAAAAATPLDFTRLVLVSSQGVTTENSLAEEPSSKEPVDIGSRLEDGITHISGAFSAVPLPLDPRQMPAA